ncbi:protein abrupt-like isoform X2 [Macrosteles quadrilineatus]|uniref:protein abrupt-like isoform X2 n=1 Tax=Macrosteles quadrilineatus TaxID=74068 RepID=UPI0023E0AD5A|nr:protein abrupt-like isoform X2 [Macrosteles quadrilineatus]
MESTTENNLLSLKWNGFTDNIISSLNISLDHQDFVDVTLVCEGGSIKAHRLILSASSSFFQRVLKENICPHPVIVLKGITLSELEPLLMFIYHGEARTFQENVPRLLEAAHFLEIRGLTSEYGQRSSDFKIPKENLDGFDEINDSHQTGVHSTTQEVNELFSNVETFNPFVRRNEFQSGTESECETNGSERTDMVIKQEPLEEEESNTQNLKDPCNRTPTSPITTKYVSHSDQNDTCQAGLKFSIQDGAPTTKEVSVLRATTVPQVSQGV